MPEMGQVLPTTAVNSVTSGHWAFATFSKGRLDEAREIVERLRPSPTVVLTDARQLWDAELRELLRSGGRMATGETELPVRLAARCLKVRFEGMGLSGAGK